jgi:hypothetical protein
MAMTDATPAKPMGFTIVPPRLEAINLLFHIDRMAIGAREHKPPTPRLGSAINSKSSKPA